MRFRKSALALSSAAALLSACVHYPPPTFCPRFDYELCVMELVKGDLKKAETYCDLALEFSPQRPEVWATKGDIALARGDTARAQRHFLQALRYDSDQWQALVSLGSTFLEGDEARTELCAVQAASPGNAALHHSLGTLEHAERNLEGAFEHLSRATQLEEAEPLYWHDLGMVLLDQYRFDEAAQVFFRCLGVDATYTDCERGMRRAWRGGAP